MVCVGYIRQLLKVYSRLLVVRMDLSLMRDQQTLLKNAYSLKEIHSKHDLVHIKACVKKLLNNKRNNPVMKMVVGYILRFEYTVRTGFHVHCYFLFNGDKNLEDITLAQSIGKLWNKVTQGQGTSYICNMKKDSIVTVQLAWFIMQILQSSDICIKPLITSAKPHNCLTLPT